ncbi:conserved Plasmodium protein, unknown function [Plasmodium chabaudi chabaudi]|uniref:RNA-binding protein n=1 Tax=Plasmodium chabaudi chabaudi TaxID=31271 RepID=A0A077TQK8_PLACU|nr:conserved Plasmodium protein, unknown function [Plasmodium chabaudi chabaudi]SCM23616.1 conserved Plasmodium protein, unknown function [Plasmodium chabaudi chabaudi]SCN61083.1 conserved Plasmodium protein, unknown function [Plasmodium chabaudi chabaudi]VTZ69159.1 conserved Plasmodium protein, unknown function [Plasmodium chabaudi chabaudi]|eukprot:XP_740312.1 conserved Plasmodium protein, unknown function [Plasmodium chabaudi chabaudi]
MESSYRKTRTIELQKRKVTQSKNVSSLSERKLPNIYAPKDFDENSTIIVCNFPQTTTINECRNFMQWIGPIIKVEKISSLMQENNFVVVFCNPYFAKVALETPLLYENKTKLFTKAVEKRDTLWKGINDMLSTNISFFS